MSEVNIQVAVRIRPLLPKELLRHHSECVKVVPGSAQVVVNPDRLFTFDHAFGPSASQDEVYRSCIQPMVRSLMDGYNATVFCYGETGSGKTYTISGGSQERANTSPLLVLDDEGGIIERVARDLFGCLDERLKNNDNDVATVHVSYLELYMEEVRDLLDLPINQKGLAVRDDVNGNTGKWWREPVESAVNSAEELLSLVEMSSAARQTCTTGMNDKSSRSHTVLTILITQHCNNKLNTICSSKFCLVDLAGSERVKKTGNTGKHFKESIHINTDLLAVGNVIRALSDRTLNYCGKTRKSSFVPFRDAKITRLLRDSLGGTSHTLMMTCVSPSGHSLAETLNALYFASKARHIRNRPAKQTSQTDQKYNHKLAQARISELENEVKLLKEVIEEKQMMIKEVSLENVSPEDQRAGDVKLNQGEPLQCCVLAQEAAGLLAKVSSPSPSFKQQLQDWRERLTATNHQCPGDGMDLSDSPTLKLKEEIDKCKEALSAKEEQMQQKDAEQRLLQRQVQILLQENKSYLQDLEEEKKRSPLETEHYLEQQMSIRRLRQNLLAARTLLLEAGAPGTADDSSQSVCLTSHGCKYETTRRVHSSPPAFSLERVMADFKMRGHVLLAENEEKDNNKLLLTAPQVQSRDMAEVDEDAGVDNRGLRYISHMFQKRSCVVSCCRTDLNKTWTWHEKNVASSDRTEQTSDSTDYIHAKQVREKEKLKASETKKRLRDLSVIMGMKKDFIKELVKTGASRKAVGRKHQLKSCWLETEEEVELRRRAELQKLEDEQKRRDEVLKHREACAQQINKLEFKMLLSGQNAELLRQNTQKQKELKALLTHSRYSREGRDDVLQTLSMHGQQIQAQVYSSVQHMKKQRAELQARLRQIEETSNNSQTTNLFLLIGKRFRRCSCEQKQLAENISCWLETEEEVELRRRAELQKLEDEQKRRDEVLKHREACAQQINKLEFKMLLSGQNLGEDLLRVSMSLDSLERSSTELQSRDSTNTKSQEEERQMLRKKRDTLQAQLKDSRVLSVQEEESLVLLEEDREALDAALEFENSCIQERQKRLNTNSSSNRCPDTEPDQLAAVIRKIRRLSATEASDLLIKYFNKVICLRETLQNVHLRCEELELVVREREMMVNKMDSDRQRLTLDADRRLTQLQRDHQINIQQLLQKLKGEETEGAMKHSRLATKKGNIQRKSSFFYKSSARELKKKLRQTGTDVSQF
uniref:Kinesin motor domain-containing protein n=1 Tax=Tetraodon nigroviridis TaxID=99883 RepID=H3CKG8_TETNG